MNMVGLTRDFISPLEARAAGFAYIAHAGQARKYTGEPYVRHLAEVANTVLDVGGSEDMIVAAWLHDVVEDTNTSLAQVRQIFGAAIEEMVEMLTDVSKPSDGNRAARKTIDRIHSAKASPQAKTIKLADLLSNSRSIVAHAPDTFKRVYLAEKALLLDVLREGHRLLWRQAWFSLESAALFYGLLDDRLLPVPPSDLLGSL